MTAEFLRELQAIPQFATFRGLIEQNIGFFPAIVPDPTSSSHRVRQYDNPPAAEIRYSTRALARYILTADLLSQAIKRNDAAVLAASMLLMRGEDLLRRNRFVGLALVAKAFDRILFEKVPDDRILQIALEQCANAENTLAPINALFPLAHEIGHLAEAKRYYPEVFFSDGILETYRINYELVRNFTGEFDYASSLDDPESPLFIPVLREEAGSDSFAAAAMLHLFAVPGEGFPLELIAMGAFLFPLHMTIEALCSKDMERPALQQAILAMQCRYSLLVDSVRAHAKSIFYHRSDYRQIEPVINATVDDIVSRVDKYYELVWDGFRQFAAEFGAMRDLDQAQIVRRLQESNLEPRRRFALSGYLELLTEETRSFPISPDNVKALKEMVGLMHSFDEIVVTDAGVVLKGPKL